ncbi:MAG TPA: hypothetical protein VG317_02075 [Pseudonocardiaceae bacterium]|nr:hypothetical protein [Pseudonocardiaceae bacterium]
MTFLADPVDSVDSLLREMLAHGFRFVHPTGAAGEIVAVVGVRLHHDVVDVVCLRGEGEAKAARMPSDEPDVLAPTRTIWQQTGRADLVLAALLALPDEPDRHANGHEMVFAGASGDRNAN